MTIGAPPKQVKSSALNRQGYGRLLVNGRPWIEPTPQGKAQPLAGLISEFIKLVQSIESNSLSSLRLEFNIRELAPLEKSESAMNQEAIENLLSLTVQAPDTIDYSPIDDPRFDRWCYAQTAIGRSRIPDTEYQSLREYISREYPDAPGLHER